MKTQEFNPPFTIRVSWQTSDTGDKPSATLNIYNSFGVAIARAIDENTAAMIAAALNAYDPRED